MVSRALVDFSCSTDHIVTFIIYIQSSFFRVWTPGWIIFRNIKSFFFFLTSLWIMSIYFFFYVFPFCRGGERERKKDFVNRFLVYRRSILDFSCWNVWKRESSRRGAVTVLQIVILMLLPSSSFLPSLFHVSTFIFLFPPLRKIPGKKISYNRPFRFATIIIEFVLTKPQSVSFRRRFVKNCFVSQHPLNSASWHLLRLRWIAQSLSQNWIDEFKDSWVASSWWIFFLETQKPKSPVSQLGKSNEKADDTQESTSPRAPDNVVRHTEREKKKNTKQDVASTCDEEIEDSSL